MDYLIGFRRSPAHRAEYQREPETHLAHLTAEAVVLEGWELLEIRYSSDSFPLTVAEILERERAKAMYRKAWGENRYADEEAYALNRFRSIRQVH